MAAAATPQSPSSSPRLPSPPPMAEDQAGPLSPIAPPGDHSGFPSQSKPDQSAARRIRPGTKAIDMNEGPPLLELSDIDSAFQLTEHLKALHYTYTHPPQLPTTQPITRSTASLLASVPSGTERSLWLYELCRFLVQKINVILTSLFTDSPPCSGTTCPEMRASEWQYLCAVHDPPKSCCAIDYCCHTLDWAANTLTSPKFFPSRLSLGTDSGQPQTSGMQSVTRQHQERQLTNVFRRVYRIFAHAWFQHREVFWRVEGRTGLYVLFKTVCDSYALIPDDNYTIPPEAEGLEGHDGSIASQQSQAAAVASASQPPPGGILKRSSSSGDADTQSQADAGAATARRHRHAPSRSGTTVTTVPEESEEDDTMSTNNGGNSNTTPTNTSSTPDQQQQQRPPPPKSPLPQPPPLPTSKTSILHPHGSFPSSSSPSSTTFPNPSSPTRTNSAPHDALPTLSTNIARSSNSTSAEATLAPTTSDSDSEPTTSGFQSHAPPPTSHSTVSPTSPLAMTSAEIAAAGAGGEALALRPKAGAPLGAAREAEAELEGKANDSTAESGGAGAKEKAEGKEEKETADDSTAESEDVAKAALTKAEGLQAGVGEAADEGAAMKTVED